MSKRSRALVGWTSVIVAVALVSGCSNGDDPSTTSASGSTTTAATTPVTTPTSETTAPTPTITSSPSATSTPTKTRWPKALGEPQGQSAWGVYLAVAHSSSDPALDQAQDEAAKVGYGAVIGDLACDRGAIDALGLDPHDYWTGAVLYFKSERDAEDFANSYLASGGTVIGTAKIGLGCLD